MTFDDNSPMTGASDGATPPKKPAPNLSDEELIAALQMEEAGAVDTTTGELAKERADALDRYRGAPLGNEVEGRSQIVDRSIMDTIEWIMPSLIRIYLGGDEIGKFEPVGPQDEEAAKAETDVCNWYLETKNDIFSQINATLRDALLLKNGYMIGVWQKRYDTMTETYTGLADEEAAMLAEDPEVTVVEHTEYPNPVQMPPMPQIMGQPPQPQPQSMLHDVKVEMKACDEYVGAESVPPDEMIVSRRHRWTSLLDCDFVEWVRRNVTIGQLRAEGFDIPDDAPGYDSPPLEAVSRDRFSQQAQLGSNDDSQSPDPSRRIVTFRDAYIRIDLRKAGTPQLWRLARVSGMNSFALKEEANIIPFAAFTPIIYPHSHIGTSIYDLIADLGIIKTTLERQALDGIYLQNSGRVAVDVTKLVNLDDLLVSRPGGVIRTEGPPGEALMPITSADSSMAVLGMLEFVEAQKTGRTGVTPSATFLDANTLAKTATGVQAVSSAANQRLELIARTLASGFKDLFLIVHALASKHSTKALQIKLNGKWTSVDPREWKKRTDFSISVGMGTGNPDQQLQKLLTLGPLLQAAQSMGLSGPMEAYNYGKEVWKNAGYKLSDKFIHPPPMGPQMGPNGQPVMGPDGQPVMVPQTPPPQENPAVTVEKVKGQTQMQLAQVKAGADQQIAQAKEAAQQQVEQARANADMQVQQHKVTTDAQLDIAKTKMQLNLQDVLHAREQQTAITIARINADAKIIAAQVAGSKLAGSGAEVANARFPGDMQQ